jgi:hypothetical protein
VSGETITLALDRMTQLRELTWGDPYHPATPEELARVAGGLLRRTIQAEI